MSARKRSLWILEPLFRGHHGSYVQWIIQGGIQRGYQVLLATESDNVRHPLLPLLQEEFKSALQIAFLPKDSVPGANAEGLLGLMAQENRFYRLFGAFFRENCRSEPPSFVLLPYLDYCMNALSLRGSPFGVAPWGGITIRPIFHLRPMGVNAPRTWLTRIKQLLFFRLLQKPTLTTLFTIDPMLAQFVTMRRADLSARCQYLPDPAEMKGSQSKQAARSALGIADTAVIILVYGVMNARKGLDVLLRAMQEKGFPDNGQVILAGQQDAETASLMASPLLQSLLRAGRLHIINAFFTKEEEYRVFAAADLLWMGYRQHYVLSGVMVQAGQMGLPVVGCEGGLIGWLIKNKHLGITVPIHDPRKVADAIGEFMRNTEKVRSCGENGRLVFASHTPEIFIQLLYNCISDGK